MAKYEVKVTTVFDTGYDRCYKHYWDNALDAVKDFYDSIKSERKLFDMNSEEIDFIRIDLNIRYTYEVEQVFNNVSFFIDSEGEWLA